MALGALVAVLTLLAVLPAAPGSTLVLATAGGSPDWLLGPLRGLGLSAAAGPRAGAVYLAGLAVAFGLYVATVRRAGEIRPGTAIAVLAGLHLVFLLAPPLLSQDVFSYLAYARLDVVHGLDPYVAVPLDIPEDAVLPFTGSTDAVSAYGPLFTIASLPLATVSVPFAFWVLKVVAAAASLGVVALVWRTAVALDRDPVAPALLVGLNPHTLVHVVAGAHNEALVVLLTVAGVAAFVAGRERTGAATATLAAGVKASAGLVVPFLLLGTRGGHPPGGRHRAASRSRWLRGGPAPGRRLLGPTVAAAGAGAVIVAAAVLGFGADALDALGLIGSNQARSSAFSFPVQIADLLPGERATYLAPVRAAFALAFLVALAWLLLRTWRGADPIAMAGWATLAVLAASAWLVPWYMLWLLPLAALAGDRRLVVATLALSAWCLPIAVPL